MQKVKMASTDYILQIQAMVNSSFLRGEKKENVSVEINPVNSNTEIWVTLKNLSPYITYH